MTQNFVRSLRNSAAGLALIMLWIACGWTHQTDAKPQAASASSSEPVPVLSAVPDLSGLWEIRDMNGAGLRGGAVMGHPNPPVLTQQAKDSQRAQVNRANAGNVVSDASQYCRTHAYPLFMTSSPPFDIIQGPNEVMVLAEPFTSPDRCSSSSTEERRQGRFALLCDTTGQHTPISGCISAGGSARRYLENCEPKGLTVDNRRPNRIRPSISGVVESNSRE